MAGYTGENIILGFPPATQVLGAGITNQAISKNSRVEAGDALNIVLDVDVDAVTVGAGVTATLQDSWDQVNWATVGAGGLSIAAPGRTTFRFNVENTADEPYMPLRSWIRVVATTGAGSALSVTAIWRGKMV